MLDTAFPRLSGDAGNADSYSMPVAIKVVNGVDSLDIVINAQPSDEIVDKFCAAAQSLQTQGAKAIVSTCGFLVSVQNAIASSVTIPVMLSPLTLYPTIYAVVGNRPIGIITASKSCLGTLALGAAGIQSKNVRIAGMEDCSIFSKTFIVQKELQCTNIDQVALQKSVVGKAQILVDEFPEVSAIILECGNLPPYANAIENAIGRPVFSILDGAELLWINKHSI